MYATLVNGRGVVKKTNVMESYTELLQKADEIAEKYHKGQKDKAGAEYVAHPRRVAEYCLSDEAKIVALLHDTIEDTIVTPTFLLKNGFPQEIIDAILSVTRQDGESYDDFILRAKNNPIGREVKIADLLDNMNITRLPYPLQEKDFARLNKYLKAYKILTNPI